MSDAARGDNACLCARTQVQTFTKCGFSWGPPRSTNRAPSGQRSAFFKYGCHRSGAHPPSPFPNGNFQLLSADLARRVGTSASIAAFVRGAMTARIDTARHGHDRHEDVLLGHWVAHLDPPPLEPIAYLDVTRRLVNLGCFKADGLYMHPNPQHLAVHFVKSAAGQRYLWDVMHGGRPHDAFNCSMLAGVS